MTAALETFKVLIAGGGVAGLEGALALRDMAGDRVVLKLLAPDPEFVYRPMTVREPFAYGQAQRYPLREIARDIGMELLDDAFASVDTAGRTACTRLLGRSCATTRCCSVSARASGHATSTC